MCHDIEDPTFDATAIATNPRAQVRPIHRPPRHPADRAAALRLDGHHRRDPPEVLPIPALAVLERSRAAPTRARPDRRRPRTGSRDYSGDLVSDIDFDAFSHSALVRIADEVCLQGHLLNLSFVQAVERRATDEAAARRICLNQLSGHAGLTAERLQRALGEGDSPRGRGTPPRAAPDDEPDVVRRAGAQWFLHPGTKRSAAHEDGAWIALCGPDSPQALQVRRTRRRPAPRRRDHRHPGRLDSDRDPH